MSAFDECPFCKRLMGRPESGVEIFEPLNPVVPGHMLVVPVRHVADFAADPLVSAATMRRAAEYVTESGLGPCNLITSRGHEATQSVYHLHLHIVPRGPRDGLLLPWTNQAAELCEGCDAEVDRGRCWQDSEGVVLCAACAESHIIAAPAADDDEAAR